jgi:hypothetical protein
MILLIRIEKTVFFTHLKKRLFSVISFTISGPGSYHKRLQGTMLNTGDYLVPYQKEKEIV